MSDPFNRGWNRTDFYAASLVAMGQIWNRPDDAFAVLDSIEPGVHDRFGGTVLTPATLVSVTSRYVFVAIAGTQGFEQWVLNILGSGQIPSPSLVGLVSAWFQVAGGNVYAAIGSTVNPHLATKRLVLLGHSLGGACCQIAADLFRPQVGAGMQVFTLGAPRVGDPSWAAHIGGPVVRCENTNDPIVALPPVLWGGLNVLPPLPSPVMPVIYQHAGDAKTLDASGQASDGSNPMPLLQVLDYFKDRAPGTHLTQTYAQRLRLGLTSADLTPLASGYAKPSMLDAIFKDIAPGFFPGSLSADEEETGMRRFTLFFNIGSRAGYTEEFYADVSSSIWTNIIKDYLDKRLALCASEVVFKYARISHIPATRKVSWRDDTDFPVNARRGFFTEAAMAAPEQAIDYRMIMSDDSPARLFLHGFPRSQFDGENLTYTPGFEGKLNNFRDLIKNGTYLFQSQTSDHSPISRIGISSIAPMAPRGCVITPAAIPTLAVGDTVQIGGQGARILGLNGRKKVIAIAPGGATFTIGGAEPVGNPADIAAGAYFYICAFQYLAPTFTGAGTLTTHKVGRPFGVRPGRRENTIPLRQ